MLHVVCVGTSIRSNQPLALNLPTEGWTGPRERRPGDQ